MVVGRTRSGAAKEFKKQIDRSLNAGNTVAWPDHTGHSIERDGSSRLTMGRGVGLGPNRKGRPVRHRKGRITGYPSPESLLY